MKINMTNKDGVTLLTKGKYCTEDIEVTPTFETGGGGATVEAPGGTPVIGTFDGASAPTEVEVENIYFNTALSVEEVVATLSGLTYSDMDGMQVIVAYYGASVDLSTQVLGAVIKIDTDYAIMDFVSGTPYFASSGTLMGEEVGFTGWNPDFSGIVVVNGVLGAPGLQVEEGVYIDNQQASYSNIMSLTPNFEPKIITLNGVYEGASLSFTANGGIDVEALIENDKKIPLSVTINVPNLLKNRLEGTLSGDATKYMNGVSHLDDYAFAGCTEITDIVIPDTQGKLGRGVFLNCTNLKNVIIPEGVTEIDAGCFAHCWGLDDVKIPATVTYIGGTSTMLQLGAFELSNVKRISFAENSQLQEIGDRAFNWCVYLEEIELPENLIKIGQNAIYNCEIRSLVFPKSMQKIDTGSVVACDRLTSVLIPDASNLTISRNAIIGKALTIYCETKNRPGSWATDWTTAPIVWDCNNNDIADDGYIYVLSNWIRYGIKDGVASVMAQPSPANNNNPTVELPDNITYKNNSYVVTTIGEDAFEDCFNIKTIVFPSNLVSIGSWAFHNGGSIQTSVTLFDFRNATQVPILNVSAFGDLKGTCKIIVPDNLYNEWIVAEWWSEYASYIIKASEYTE